MSKALCDEISVPEYSIQILSKCLELGIQIWGGDDRSTYSASSEKFDRYSMNRDIANIIRTLVEAGKKVISFYGIEHNNTRTYDHGSMGIPYYITGLRIPFLVIKDLRMHRDAYHYIEPLIREIKDKFIGIRAIPEVDFPHYFIQYPTSGSGSGTIGHGGRRKYNTHSRRYKNVKKHRSKHRR